MSFNFERLRKLAEKRKKWFPDIPKGRGEYEVELYKQQCIGSRNHKDIKTLRFCESKDCPIEPFEIKCMLCPVCFQNSKNCLIFDGTIRETKEEYDQLNK